MKKKIDAALLAQAKGALARHNSFNRAANLVHGAECGAGEKTWFKINQAAGSDEAEILLYQEIGYFGINADDFSQQLAAIDAKTINLRINSPGGSVFAGICIYANLVQHPARIIAHVDSLAASIASVIMCAADEIIIGESAQAMIHAPHSVVMGPAEDMRKEADVLDSIEEAIIDIYVARTGGDREEIKAMVAAETWLRGQAAVDAGFADKVMPNKKKPKASASFGGEFYTVAFPNMPADALEQFDRAAEAPNKDKFDFSTATPREIEDFMRSHNATNKQAKVASTAFKPAARDERLDQEDSLARDELAADTKSRDETVQALLAFAAATAIRQMAAISTLKK